MPDEHCAETEVTARGTLPTTTAPSPTPTNINAGDEQRNADNDADDDSDESGLFAIDFMFEGSQPSRMEYFTWKLENTNASAMTTHEQSTAATSMPTTTPTIRPPTIIQVALSIADDNPGAVQSGHYLWPAAKLLADYLVQQHSSGSNQDQPLPAPPSSVLELGAGCALLSLTALQLWQESLQCVVVTDHDPGTLERARNNYESTLQKVMDASSVEEDWMDTINNLGSIPVLFESLAWSCKQGDNGDGDDAARIRLLLEEHTNTHDSEVDVILGSDLIYDIHVVEPLLATAARFLSKKQRQQSASSPSSSSCYGGGGGGAYFLLSQSFPYDDATEQEIDASCQKLGLQRKILWQEQDNAEDEQQEHEDASDMDKKKKSTSAVERLVKKRIQEFRWLPES